MLAVVFLTVVSGNAYRVWVFALKADKWARSAAQTTSKLNISVFYFYLLTLALY